MKLIQLIIGYILIERVFTIGAELQQNEYLPNKNMLMRKYNEVKRSKRFSLYNAPWNKKQLTWNFLNKGHSKSAEDAKQIRKLLRKAFNEWQKNSQLKVLESNDELVNIKVLFGRLDHGDGSNFDGTGGVLAHAFPPNDYPPGGEIHFDEDEHWDFYGNNSKEADFFSAALHEIGHALGLLHSSVRDSVMYPNYKYRKSHKLHDDDKQGIQKLFGVKKELSSKNLKPIQRSKVTQQTTKATVYRKIQKIELPDLVPDTCNTSYDAIAMLRNEIFIFKGQYMWRLRNNVLLSGYPVKTRHMWNKLPNKFTHIDAVFENQKQKEIWIFIGTKYFVFNANKYKFKRRLTHLGLPKDLKKIDSIFTWGRNNVTYIFSGDEFWRLDDELKRVRENYSKQMAVYWRNAANMDTAFQINGTTYFFQNKVFYQFDDRRMKLNLNKPKFSSQFWMKCEPIQNSFDRHKRFYW